MILSKIKKDVLIVEKRRFDSFENVDNFEKRRFDSFEILVCRVQGWRVLSDDMCKKDMLTYMSFFCTFYRG